jgi:predicted TIM-barrel fold metal-dependent hydrolase
MTEIIDAHVHIMPPERLRGLMRWIKRAFPAHPVDSRIGEDGIRADLENIGIRFFFNYVYPLTDDETHSLNDFNHHVGGRLPEAAPFGSLHIDTPRKKSVVKKCMDEYQFVGLKFHPFVQKFNPADERLFCVYEIMEEISRPVVLHTGFDEFYRQEISFEQLEGILSCFPSLPLVLSHAIFPRFGEAQTLAERYPNVYLDVTNVFGALKMHEAEDIPESFRTAGERYIDDFREMVAACPRRILFGSDHPAGMGGLKEIYRDFFDFGLPESVAREILWETPLAFIERFAPHIHGRWVFLMDG